MPLKWGYLERGDGMRPRIYAKVSTEKQEKEKTIQSQLADLREFSQKDDLSVDHEYIDEGYSGGLLDRPALDRLRDDAKKGLFDKLLVHSPDRLSRDFVHLCLLRDELAGHGVKIIYLNRPERGDTPEDKLLENVEGVVAEYEKAKILEPTRRDKLHKATAGFVVGGKAPHGYRYVPGDKNRREPGHYEVVKKEAEVVQVMFRLLVNDKMSTRGIARELTKRGIAPRHGKHWRTSTVHRILRNETYIGTTYYNKHMAAEPQNGNGGNGYRRRKNASLKLRPVEQWIPIELPKSLSILGKAIRA
jgi:site-specific DNA recombinase